MSVKKILNFAAATLLIVVLVAAVATFGAQTSESNLVKKLRSEATTSSDMTGLAYPRSNGCFNYCRYDYGKYNCGALNAYFCCESASQCVKTNGIFFCNKYATFHCPFM